MTPSPLAPDAADAVPQTPTEPDYLPSYLVLAENGLGLPPQVIVRLVRELMEARSSLASLTADNQRMTADAERYRTIRDRLYLDYDTPPSGLGHYVTMGFLVVPEEAAKTDDVDAAIDAARRSGEERERPTSEAT